MTAAPALERQIGLGGAILLSFNGAVGAAIFALPATLAADFGTFSPWLFPLVALAALIVIVPFSRSVAAFPESGGPAAYGAVFGRFAGFELGWIYYVARAAAFAANANVLVSYLARWWPIVGEGPARAAVLLTVCAGLAAINIAGTGRAIRVLGGLTLLKALPLLIAAITALFLYAPLPAPGPPPPLDAFEAGALLVFYAFVGFENAVVPAGETKRPESTLPRAMLTTIAITATLYFLVQMAFVAMFPEGGADKAAPLIDLGSRLAGPFGALALTFAAACSLGGNLHGIMVSTPRVTYAMAARGDLPRWFAGVSPRFATPSNSILFLAAFTALLAISGSFVWLAVVSTLARMIIYAVTIASLPRAPLKPRVTPFAIISGGAGILLCGWAALQADAAAWKTLAALALAGIALYAIARRATGSESSATTVSSIQPPPSNRDPS
ncbi:MAG TPA: APC family permease [Sphingomicrobium sp.]|nr:APC family permease [Sphingomicrobium sp.]